MVTAAAKSQVNDATRRADGCPSVALRPLSLDRADHVRAPRSTAW